MKEVQHEIKVGDRCKFLVPNVTDDCIFTVDGEDIGFYIRSLADFSQDADLFASIANKELRSKNVPKSSMKRSSGFISGDKKQEVLQYSTIIGSVPPKPHMRRNYPTMSSVHSVKTAKTFIKAMLMLCRESEEIIRRILPDVFERQIQIIQNEVPKKWRFGRMFTSSISNFNISAPFHRDTGNLKDTVNIIICKKKDTEGGDLHVPDYNATIGQEDGSMLVYPAWKNVHGVTPILRKRAEGYRNSLVFYPLAAFKNCR